MKTLLLKLADGRELYTFEKNYPLLIEYSKKFNVELTLIDLRSGTPLTIQELVQAICDPTYKTEADYLILETKIKQNNNRANILKISKQIQAHINRSLLDGEIVSIKKLKEKFAGLRLTTGCYCNHLRRAIQGFKSKNINVDKLDWGEYKLK